MSQSKVLGTGAAVAALPVTGNSVATMAVIAGVMIFAGALMIRAARLRGHEG